MARMVAAVDSSPWEVRKARSAADRLALDQGKRHVAAEDHPALAAKPLGKAVGERADRRNRRDAERDAGDEDIEAAQPAAQFAQRQAKRQAGAGRCRPAGASEH